jgi:hypothetical protein
MTMDCEAFRLELLADPAAGGDAMGNHEAECGPCAAFAERVRRAEVLISKALRFDVAAVHTQAEPAPKRWMGGRLAGLAAAVVVVAVLGLGRNFLNPSVDTMSADLAEHWHHESFSWVVTDQPAQTLQLTKAVAGLALIDFDQLPTVTYAHSCFFRGKWVPHLVIQGEAGPVMVMLLPAEEIGKPMTLQVVEENLEGMVIPHGQGSIAILATEGEAMEPLQKAISRAVEWST